MNVEERYRVVPTGSIDLAHWDPGDTGDFEKGKAAEEQTKDDVKALDDLQELLYVAGSHGLLIVLQGIDGSGKDGTVRHVLSGLDPIGVRVVSFKQPSKEELAHDYLWRIHQKTPERGEIVIFNRSHYEDVLVVRVNNLAPESVWRPRYQSINDFERMLAESGTIVLKFFLHISRDEQLERLREREQDPEKRWKVNPGDWQDRQRWDGFQTAYQDVLNLTSTEWAPWYVVPADKKWYRNLVIAGIVRDRLQAHAQAWQAKRLEIGQKRIVELAEARKAGIVSER